MLAPRACRGDQCFHVSVTGIHRSYQRVGIRRDVVEGIAPLGHLAVDNLFVVVNEGVPLPVSCSAQFAGALRIVEADEEAVDVCGLVSPNHVKAIQLPCRTIGMEFREQTRAVRN